MRERSTGLPHRLPSRRRLTARILAVAGITVAGFSTSCAASFQTMYEGDVMFEHCYRLDIDAAVAAPEKRVCWERWLATNTRGQTRDRVEFAAARSRSLVAGPNASGVAFLRILDPRAGDPAPSTSVACPLPETPFEAPPPTLAAVPAKASAAIAPPPAASSATAQGKSKGRACFDACGADLAGCASKCGNARCSQKCTDEVKKCMGSCT